MKFSTAAAVLSILSLNGLASVAALPMYADYDLDVRREAMDTQSEMWARYNDEELELANRDADYKFDIAKRDLMEAVLYQRMMEAVATASNLETNALGIIGAATHEGITTARPHVTETPEWEQEMANHKKAAHQQEATTGKGASAPALPRYPKLERLTSPGTLQEERPQSPTLLAVGPSGVLSTGPEKDFS